MYAAPEMDLPPDGEGSVWWWQQYENGDGDRVDGTPPVWLWRWNCRRTNGGLAVWGGLQYGNGDGDRCGDGAPYGYGCGEEIRWKMVSPCSVGLGEMESLGVVLMERYTREDGLG